MRTICLFFGLAMRLVYADQVVLKNGDTLTGSIIQKDGAKLTLKSEFLGEVTMPWSVVQSIKSDAALTVVLPGGEAVNGKIATTGERIEVAGKSAPISEVAAVRNADRQHAWERLQHPGLLELWTGFFDLGLALTRGNSRADTLTTGFNASRITPKDKIVVRFAQMHASARTNGVTSTTASAILGGWTYDRSLTPRFFVTTLNDYEHDRFQNLNLRFVLGGGFGFNAVKTEKANLSLMGGADYSHESFFNDFKRNSAELNFGNDFLYKFSSVTSVTQAFRMFPNLSHSGEYRMNFDVAGVTAIKKWLAWHLTAGDRYLSNPVFGRQRNDLILATGFRVSFAR